MSERERLSLEDELSRQAGEEIHAPTIISHYLRQHSRLLYMYLEARVSGAPTPSIAHLEEFYGFGDDLANHFSFGSGFARVVNWYQRMYSVMQHPPKRKVDEEEKPLPPPPTVIGSHPLDTLRRIRKQEALEKTAIHVSLLEDPTGIRYLDNRLSQAERLNQMSVMEYVGARAAIGGIRKMDTLLRKT